MAMPMFKPPHPGSLLKQALGGKTVLSLAVRIGVSADYLQSVIDTKAAITPELCAKLSEILGTGDRFWLRMQRKRDNWVAEKSQRDGSAYPTKALTE